MAVKPKYLQTYEDIKEKIMTGIYAINERIADGKSLAKQYDVSMMTVKKALDLLVSEGLLVRRRGDGTFVKDWTKGSHPNFYAINGTYSKFPGKVDSEVIKFDIQFPDEEIAEKLAISTDSFVYIIIRVRIIEQVPSIVEYTYMPVSIIRDLSLEHVENSIYSYIKEELKLNIQSSFLNIQGVRPNELEKKYLHVKDTDFLMQVEQVANLDDGRIFEYSIAKHIPAEFKFETVIFN